MGVSPWTAWQSDRRHLSKMKVVFGNRPAMDLINTTTRFRAATSFPHIDGGDAECQVEMPGIAETGSGHEPLEILAAGELQDRVRKIPVGAETGE